MENNKKIKLLYVEDSKYDINLTKSYFKKNAPEFELFIEESGEACLSLLQKETFDILLLDNQLPDMEGLDILEKIYRADLKYPIIVLTAVGNEDIFIKSLTLGASDYIPKTENYHKSLPLTLQTILEEFKINRDFKESNSLDKLNVLYIEHNYDDIETVSRFFSKNKSNIVFEVVKTVEQAEEILLANHNIDAVLCDFNMPDENGFDFFKRIKYQLKNVPFIFITGVENIDSAIAVLKLGAYDYIIKDYNYVSRLNNLINNAVISARLDNKNSEQEKKLKSLTSNLDMRVKERTYKLVQEIEERKKKEKELIQAKKKAEESEKLKTSFLWMMSHELRTPLSAINGFSELLFSEKKPEKIERYVRIINSSGNHLLQLIEEVFTISLLESGTLVVNNKNINLNDFLSNIEAIFKAECLKKNKNIRLNFVKNKLNNDIVVHTDEGKLKQIVSNLLNNAIKFTEEGSVSFGYEEKIIKDIPVIEFFVKDTGIGIENEKLEIIFDVFRQADERINRTFGGTGIGLSVVKKLCFLLGGDVEVVSKIGYGSIFRFHIPSIETIVLQEHNTEIKVAEPHLLPLTNKTILIVEDDSLNSELLSIIVENSGAKSIRVKNGVEALEMGVNNKDIDLILMDLHLPELSGFEATMGIKNSRKDMPIIAQTALVQTQDKEKALLAGCDDYITKPYKPEQLIEMILNHIK